MAYGNALQSALHGMSQPAGNPTRLGAPPNVGMGSPPPAQAAQTNMKPVAQPPKTLQEVLHSLLENTNAKLDGHELMDLIRAAIQHGGTAAGNAISPIAQGAVQAGRNAASAIGGNQLLQNTVNPILGGVFDGLRGPQ